MNLPAAQMDDAVNRGAVAEVLDLLSRGVDPNVRDVVGDPVIMSAAWVGAPDVIQVLIDRGADVNAVGRDGQNALQRLLRNNTTYWHEGHDRAVALLREYGARE